LHTYIIAAFPKLC